RIRPGSPDPYYGLGAALRALGEAAGARAAFEKYIALEKRPSEQRWVDRARQELKELTPAAPSPKPVAPPPLDLARAAVADHRWPVARIELDDLLEAHPDDAAALLLRADVRRAQGDSDGAAADAAHALALRPANPAPLRLLGEALAATDPERSRYYLEL